MTNTDTNSLYVLICSLTATVISLPAAWDFAAAAYAAPGWLPKDALQSALNLPTRCASNGR